LLPIPDEKDFFGFIDSKGEIYYEKEKKGGDTLIKGKLR